jgi:hypothetical protein
MLSNKKHIMNTPGRKLPQTITITENKNKALKNRVNYLEELNKETQALVKKLMKEKKYLETIILEKDVEIDLLKENNTPYYKPTNNNYSSWPPSVNQR